MSNYKVKFVGDEGIKLNCMNIPVPGWAIVKAYGSECLALRGRDGTLTYFYKDKLDVGWDHCKPTLDVEVIRILKPGDEITIKVDKYA